MSSYVDTHQTKEYQTESLSRPKGNMRERHILSIIDSREHKHV